MTTIYTPVNNIAITKQEILTDYELVCKSRQASLLARKEVLSGRAKFGIFGDGKELPQIVMAKAFQNGDFRAGYYRDQTFMFATGMLSFREFFAQLYANTENGAEPASRGRMMNNHFATSLLDANSDFLSVVDLKNSSADISCTAGQMPRLLGLAYASKLYRVLPELQPYASKFSRQGQEVAFGTIGNASTSEGHFFECMNAAGVLQVPMAMFVWDDGFGISVPAALHTVKESISAALMGMKYDDGNTLNSKQFKTTAKGIRIFEVKGWDYLALHDTFLPSVLQIRHDHMPVLFHATELTQPQGHSTSGSQERYKTPERLAWEKEYDCNGKFRAWILEQKLATEQELLAIETQAADFIEREKIAAFEDSLAQIEKEKHLAKDIIRACDSSKTCPSPAMATLRSNLEQPGSPSRKLIQANLTRANIALRKCACESAQILRQKVKEYAAQNEARYNSHLLCQGSDSPLLKAEIKPTYDTQKPDIVDGRQVLLKCFEANFARDPRIFVIGEDCGKLGDVNLVFEGLQEKFGEWRLTDTGIREASIAGQGIGAAMRGLRPIVDIQYLDYLLYALQTLSDDLASLHYRTAGQQKAPVVIRTKGHRLEGVWHSGSPMGVIINALRGIHVLVPRNMTTAAGFYNLAFQSDHPVLIIETLNAYRIKEALPQNIGEFTIPFGVPEIIRTGEHVTIATYGACCKIALDAAQVLHGMGIEVEILDVRSLLPFDIHHMCLASVKKTNALLVLDEDGPAGSSAFMMQQILEEQGAYDYLDAAPATLTAKPHRPAYGSDGDYFSKPNIEDVLLATIKIMESRGLA